MTAWIAAVPAGVRWLALLSLITIVIVAINTNPIVLEIKIRGTSLAFDTYSLQERDDRELDRAETSDSELTITLDTYALQEFPFNVGRDIGLWIDNRIDWMNDNLGLFFSAVKTVVTGVFKPVEDFLTWLPWPVFIIAVGVISWRVVGPKMAIFSICALIALAVFGLWESTMETASLMIVTVTLCIMIAVPLGVWASQSDRLDAALRPILDGMQTMPSFVYLVPVIAFFSLGNPPAVIATLIYAIPPAVRLTNLGIRQVPKETIEATESFGATPLQMMLKVKIPLAMPTIMAGVNQTTLMALAMVVIASLVGASGLGEDVLRGLGRLEAGNAFLGGLGIVFLAIIIDRNTQAFAKNQQASLGLERSVG